jgi:S-adenosylhomocysteine hydrolase
MSDGGWSSGAWGQVGWGMSLFERSASDTVVITDVDAVAGSSLSGAVSEASTVTDANSATQVFVTAVSESSVATDSISSNQIFTTIWTRLNF